MASASAPATSPNVSLAHGVTTFIAYRPSPEHLARRSSTVPTVPAQTSAR
ncbi:hypothetical protein G3M55_50145 [Streptomyces sp. SID8455]|nr:hypothetical protein [Streptomyces sp. SID8455]